MRPAAAFQLPFANPILQGALIRKPVARTPLALQGPARLGQTEGTILNTAFFTAGTINALLSAATAWVGIHTGVNQKGMLGVAGWVTGIAGALGALYSLGLMGYTAAQGGLRASGPELIGPSEVMAA